MGFWPVFLALLLALTACQRSKDLEVIPAAPRGDALRGLDLMAKHECGRCHEITGVLPAPQSKHCVDCHRDILAGKIDAPPDVLPQWRAAVAPLADRLAIPDAPGHYRRAWVERFLLDPHDLRPNLHPMMPRLALTPDEARDIATALAPADDEHIEWLRANADRGRALLEEKACGTCHLFTGVPPLPETPPAAVPGEAHLAIHALAPDLRHTRDRLRVAALIDWLRAPYAIKPGTPMPDPGLTARQARDIARYIMTAPLAPAPEPVAEPRLPVLSRRVDYEEVSRRVFRKTCWHCHGEPDYGIGDGGPGNTGGFGFKPRGLSLADYDGIASGYLDEHGERRSLFAAGPDGTPRILGSLLARREEIAGRSSQSLRGMPLGLPPLSPEEIQLVESWIAQGRPE